MSRRGVMLTERKTRPVRLRRAEANFLLTHLRQFIEVVPATEPRTYHLTPRGYVGFIDGPTVRYAIGPKIPWPNLRMMLGFADTSGGEPVEAEGGLLAVMAEEFASQLDALTRVGLVAGYGTTRSAAPFLRGKLLTAEQIRDAAAGAFPDRFHVEEPVFDLYTPWHRVLKGTACALLRRELPRPLRKRIETVMQPLAVVPEEPVLEVDYAATAAEPRAAGYLPLLEVCRLITHGLTCADPMGNGESAFLIDLGRVFERYLYTSLKRALANEPQWRVEAHQSFAVGPTELQPDILICRDGMPSDVLDAKWKTDTTDPADLHQILAYATVTGARRVGLVYPGKTDDRANFLTPDGRVSVSLHRLRVVGTAEELAASVAKLADAVRKG